MSKQDKATKPGFVIKLSNETVQKLTVEEPKPTDKSSAEHVEDIGKDSKPESVQSSSSVKIEVNETVSDEHENPDKQSNQKTDENVNSTWGDYAPYVTYEGEEAIYTDPSSQQKYIWSKTDNCWVPKASGDVPGRQYSYENDTHVYTEPDGSKLFWDTEKKAWLPKIDDDFLAYYQLSYGFVDNTTEKQTEKDKSEPKEDQNKSNATGLKRKSEPQWFEQSEQKNTKVYVSNLPLDITEEEFVNLMQKCGLVERDPSTQNMKIKLYMDKEHNCFKGDALCTYIKIESVDLALKLLDGSVYKDNTISVQRAHFQLKGEYNPALKPKKKKKKELEKIKKMQQKLFDWRPEKFIGERSKHERVVIIKNLFHPTDFDKDVQLILDYQQDMREECAKCGEVRKVVIYDRHPEGVAQVTMKEPEQADAVINLINGRWFGKKQITAEIWDGRTKYRIAETDADINQRIEKWDKFLEQTEEKNPDKKETEPKVDNANAETSVEDSVTASKDEINVS